MMNQVDVYFANGHEVLSAYWGHLSSGGLMFSHTKGIGPLREGQEVNLSIHIGSGRTFSIDCRVLRAKRDKVIVAFDSSESKSRIFSQALADQDVDVEARLRFVGGKRPSLIGRLFEISEDGCGMRTGQRDSSQCEGADVVIELGELRIHGVVVSVRGDELYIIFSTDDEPTLRAVQSQLRHAAAF